MTKDYEPSADYCHRPVPKFPMRDRTHRTRSKRPRPYKIEYTCKFWKGWHVDGSYRTEAERDQAFRVLAHKCKMHTQPGKEPWCKYRKLDPDA